MRRPRGSTARATHVVVAGQMPPPVGGQNINIKRLYDLLDGERDLKVSHLRFEFTKDWRRARRPGLDKLVELSRVVGRLIWIRAGGRIDLVLYPSGGPHTAPIIRDWVLLPVVSLVSRRVAVYFRAAGLAERMERSPRWFRFMCRAAYGGCATEAVVLTEFGRRDAEAVGLDRVTVVPNGFEDRSGASVVRPMRTTSTILHVGHLCADKGVPQLIEAFARIAPAFTNARLVLVGEPVPPYDEGQLRADIARTGAEGRIEYKGLLGGLDLEEAYRDGDLFVFASVAPYESFGMVLIEAMQWSLPIVVTDWRANVAVCGEGFGGVVAQNAECDLLEALEGALRTALQEREKWSEWGCRNRRIFESRYTVAELRSNLRALIGVDDGVRRRAE
jgi:glycosyltransferase involved in cell wall biosynthesis